MERRFNRSRTTSIPCSTTVCRRWGKSTRLKWSMLCRYVFTRDWTTFHATSPHWPVAPLNDPLLFDLWATEKDISVLHMFLNGQSNVLGHQTRKKSSVRSITLEEAAIQQVLVPLPGSQHTCGLHLHLHHYQPTDPSADSLSVGLSKVLHWLELQTP